MKNHDLLDAIGEVSEETVQKYALPDTGNIERAKDDDDMDTENSKPIRQTKKKPFRISMGTAAAAVALCLGLNAAIIFGIHKMKQDALGMSSDAVGFSEEYKCPDLIGLDYEEAVRQYGDVLQIVKESEEYSDYEAGRIFDQDTTPDTTLKMGDTVHVRVSVGSKRVRMPDVTGWDYETARQTISQLGLLIDKRSAYDPEVEKDKIISTDPEGPIDVEPGSFIRMTVSLGKCPDTVPVPNFVGMDWALAETLAEELNLKLAKKEVADSAPAGTVLSQSVEPSTEVTEESEIELTVSAGPDGQEEQAIRLIFTIPPDVKGKYHIYIQNDQNIPIAIGGTFDPEYAAGVTSVLLEGSEENMEVRAYLVNDENDKTCQLGSYKLHFDTLGYETIQEDIQKAFDEVQ